MSHSEKRLEDPRLLSGRGIFVDDLKPKDMLYCAFARSPYAKARLRSVLKPEDPRLVDFLDGREIELETNPYDKFEMPPRKFLHYALASDEVHHAGEPVAAVLASNRYDAEDLGELTKVEYDASEPPVVNPEEALHAKKRAIDDWDDNIAFEKTISTGDFARAAAESPHCFTTRTILARTAAVPIETRGIVAAYDQEGSSLDIWTPTKGPHMSRSIASNALKIPEQNVRVRVPEIGGGFGPKGYFYAEEVVASLFSIRNGGKPVKWVGTRSEDFETTHQARDQIHETTICLDNSLRITGLKDDFIIDIGIPGFLSFSPATRIVPLLPGCYRIPNVLAHYRGVVTNKTPMGPIRGNGRPEAILVVEKAIEVASRGLGVDPVELRRRNFVRPEDIPYDNKVGSVYDSGNYPEALEKVLRVADYFELRRRQGNQRNGGSQKLFGIGLSCYVEDTGLGPSAKIGRPGFEGAIVRVEKDGSVHAFSGASPHGQGHETVFSEVISRELGVPVEVVQIGFGDTTQIQKGVGSFGSRSAAIAGSAFLLSARAVKEKMTKIAAATIGCEPSQLAAKDGRFFCADGSSAKAQILTFREVARIAYSPEELPKGMALGLVAENYFDPPGITFSYGASLAVVELDRESASPRVEKFVVLDDCGRILNHQLVQGQLHGGVAHGAGNALLERLTYGEEGQLLVSNLLDYEIPMSVDVPDMEILHTETPSAMNPLGVKGAGEGGTLAALSSVFNAVCDALGSDLLNVPVDVDEVLQKLRMRDKRNS